VTDPKAKLRKFCEKLEAKMLGRNTGYQQQGIDWYSIRSDWYEELKKEFGL